MWIVLLLFGITVIYLGFRLALWYERAMRYEMYRPPILSGKIAPLFFVFLWTGLLFIGLVCFWFVNSIFAISVAGLGALYLLLGNYLGSDRSMINRILWVYKVKKLGMADAPEEEVLKEVARSFQIAAGLHKNLVEVNLQDFRCKTIQKTIDYIFTYRERAEYIRNAEDFDYHMEYEEKREKRKKLITKICKKKLVQTV